MLDKILFCDADVSDINEAKQRFVVPIFANTKHPVLNSLLWLYIQYDGKQKMVPVATKEHDNRDIMEVLSMFKDKTFIYNKYYIKNIRELENHRVFIDMNMSLWICGATEYIHDTDGYTKTHLQTYGDFMYDSATRDYVNDIIYVTKHFEYGWLITDKFKRGIMAVKANRTLLKQYKYFDERLYILSELSNRGIHVEVSELPTIDYWNKHIMSGDLYKAQQGELLYSMYNPFTSTGRPANSFAGINWLALNKKDNSRSVVTSRFGVKGKLVQFDFKAHHLNILADLIGIPKDKDLHTILAKQYFPGQEITPELYALSKERSFQNLYSPKPLPPEAPEFFHKVHDLKMSIHSQIAETGMYVSPKTDIVYVSTVDENTPTKELNYFMQTVEAEYMHEHLLLILDSTLNTGVIPILYTYDSILFDVHKDSKDTFLQLFNNINEKFPLHLSVGVDYANLKELNIWA